VELGLLNGAAFLPKDARDLLHGKHAKFAELWQAVPEHDAASPDLRHDQNISNARQNL
jgi:hypothetical protein